MEFTPFIESKTWTGGSGTGEEIEGLGPSLGRCKTVKEKKPAPNPAPVDGRVTGTVARWYGDRGFGWLRPDNGGSDIFVHVANLRRAGIDRLTHGERLSFATSTDQRSGKIYAVDIEEAY